MENKLEKALCEESKFFDEIIQTRITNQTIPFEADFRRATKYIPKGKSNKEIIDPILTNIVQGKIIRKIIERIILNGGSVLDICCGPGGLSLEIARNGLKTQGYDISESAILIAKKMAEENPYNENFIEPKYICQDVNMIKFENNTYSTIVGNSAFHHIYELETFLEKCNNSLTENGLMITWDDIGHGRLDMFFYFVFSGILPNFRMTYKEKIQKVINVALRKKVMQNEIFSPMEIWADKHGSASEVIKKFWTKKLKPEKIIYFSAFVVPVCNNVKGPDWFRYIIARILTRLDALFIKLGICQGFYRIIISTKR